ncbi:TolC family protein [Bacteroidota bacterium]
MNNRSILLSGIFCACNFLNSYSQISQRAESGETGYFSLFEIVEIAKNQSPMSLQAETFKENRYWQYRTYRSNYRPLLYMSGQFPDFSRTVDEVRQPDGTYDYLEVWQNTSQLNLFLSQSIGLTGTEVFLQSSIYRFDNLDPNNKYYNYRGNPLVVGLRQPIFTYNELKWDSRIEPLRYEESKRQYVEQMEQISIIAARRFFDLLSAQITLEISSINMANNDTIFKIAEGRYNLGQIGEDELLQLELTVMNSRQNVAQSQVDLETSTLRLKTFAGLIGYDDVILELPSELPEFDVDENTAITEARRNRMDAIGFTRRELEADRDMAQAKGSTGLNADLFATFGLSNTADELPDIYVDPLDNQTVRLGFQVPIMDWGRQKSRVKTAEANKKYVEYTVAQDIINFDEEIFTQVKRFQMLRERVKISERADIVGQKRYNIAKNRYLIGKTGITDLNIALQEKDQAKASYIASLGDFWNSYYTLRYLTLYDFEKNEVLYLTDDEL